MLHTHTHTACELTKSDFSCGTAERCACICGYPTAERACDTYVLAAALQLSSHTMCMVLAAALQLIIHAMCIILAVALPLSSHAIVLLCDRPSADQPCDVHDLAVALQLHSRAVTILFAVALQLSSRVLSMV